MTVPSLAAVVGTLAAICTTFAFLPQLVRIRRQGGHDVSSWMLLLNLTGATLWFSYGWLLGAGVIVITNGILMLFMAAALAMKHAGGPRRSPDAPRRIRIAVDMDEVIADSLPEHLRRCNTMLGGVLSVADLNGRSVKAAMPTEHTAAAGALLDAEFFADLPVMPEAQAVLAELADTYDVFIATAAMDVPVSFDAKYRWLRRHFPFIDPSRFVFCGDKTILDADYLIDDSPRHFERFPGQPAPHNCFETRYRRVRDWQEVRELFRAQGGPRADSRTKARASVSQATARA